MLLERHLLLQTVHFPMAVFFFLRGVFLIEEPLKLEGLGDALVAAVVDRLADAGGTFVAANGTFPNSWFLLLRGVILIEEPLKLEGL